MSEKVPTRNREGHAEYNIDWPWVRGEQVSGLGAVLRVRNEARNLNWTIPALVAAGVDQIHLIDNGSTDGTVQVAASAAEHNKYGEFHTYTYPHTVSRCGPEHLDTPPDSVSSLPYFYNWAFSRPSTTYGLKWDGDMVLTPLGIEHLAHLKEKLVTKNLVLRVPRHPLYIKDERHAWLDLGWRNIEAFGWPIGPDFAHAKSWDWEIPVWPENVRYRRLKRGSCLELKWLDDDEFSHWTSTDFHEKRNARKRREYLVHTALAEGRVPPVAGLVPITSTDTHVIDYVCNEWLPQAPRPLLGEAVTRYPGPDGVDAYAGEDDEED